MPPSRSNSRGRQVASIVAQLIRLCTSLLGKVAVIVAAMGIGVVAVRWVTWHRMTEICSERLLGQSRASARSELAEHGLQVEMGNPDVAASPERGFFLTWCVLEHKDDVIRRVHVAK